jgi:hypothetical protein
MGPGDAKLATIVGTATGALSVAAVLTATLRRSPSPAA